MVIIKLKWKSFNVSLRKVQSWIKSNISTELSAISPDSTLDLHFIEELSAEDLKSLEDYWDKLKKSSDEAKSYKSKTDVLNAKQSALNKLKEIAGLTEDEVNALLKG